MPFGVVTIATVKRAIHEATSTPLAAYLRSLPLASKVFLAALLARVRRTGIGEAVLGDVLDEAKRIAARLGWDVPWNEAAGGLPVGTQQRVEILKALRGETRVLIFDEPTAVLTPTETQKHWRCSSEL